VPTDEARAIARELGLDLVEISPMERPPVCRIMDYGKYKYDQKKRQKQRASHTAASKEVRLRPKTDTHDREIKINRAIRFLQDGSKVQFTMLFRGRERAHQDVGLAIFRDIVEGLGEQVKVERAPRLEGRRLTMLLAPVKLAKPSAKSATRPKPPSPPAQAPSADPSSAPAEAEPIGEDSQTPNGV
jgi:translation initiation factor IF-3